MAFAALGILAMGTLLYLHLNPDASVLKIHKTPALLVLLAANAWLWALYGLLQDDRFPLFTAFFCTFVVDARHVHALYKHTIIKGDLRKIITGAGVFLVVAALYTCAGYYGYAGQSRFQVQQALGYAAMLSMLVLLYSSLQTITLACKNRSNKSIPLGAVSVSCVNSILWTVFSIVTLDWFLFVPSSSALVLDLIQIVLYWAFRANSHEYLPLV